MVRLVVIATLFAVMGLLQSAAARDQLSSELPVLMLADEINYDEDWDGCR